MKMRATPSSIIKVVWFKHPKFVRLMLFTLGFLIIIFPVNPNNYAEMNSLGALKDAAEIFVIMTLLCPNPDALAKVGFRKFSVKSEFLVSFCGMVVSYGIWYGGFTALSWLFSGTHWYQGIEQRGYMYISWNPKEFWSVPTYLLNTFTSALWQELIYRGVLITWVKDLTKSWKTALALSVTFFMVVHFYQGLAGMIYIGLDALLLGAIFLWRGNLASVTLIHFLATASQLFMAPDPYNILPYIPMWLGRGKN